MRTNSLFKICFPALHSISPVQVKTLLTHVTPRSFFTSTLIKSYRLHLNCEVWSSKFNIFPIYPFFIALWHHNNNPAGNAWERNFAIPYLLNQLAPTPFTQVTGATCIDLENTHPAPAATTVCSSKLQTKYWLKVWLTESSI